METVKYNEFGGMHVIVDRLLLSNYYTGLLGGNVTYNIGNVIYNMKFPFLIFHACIIHSHHIYLCTS